MSEFVQSADGQDFTADRAVEDTPHARANLAGRTAELRADIFGSVLPLPVPATGTSWAIYEFDDGRAVSGDPLHDIDRRQEALILATADGRQYSTDPGQIRIVTKEYERSNTLPTLLVSEATIFRNGFAVYLQDAISFVAPDKVQTTLAPLFEVDDNGALAFCSNYDSTPMLNVPFSREQKQPIAYPFGRQESLTDRSYAINFAQAVVNCIKQAEPLAFGYAPE